MEIERPHRTTTSTPTTSDLFICFTSRLSHSSSMRLSTRSILSPGRNGGGDRSSAVTTTLSRRLRRNGSLRGGAQSPALFPATASTTKKNTGSSAFAENPEPSSPKVTCIGQVRVKTKKQGKKMKMRACGSKRIGGEASFRRIQPPATATATAVVVEDGSGGSPARNQKWVHLPLSICETLKGLGSEFSCLLPCKSSCFSSSDNINNNNNNNDDDNNGYERENSGGSSCGGVFRWLVSLQEGEEGRRRDIELVVGGDEDEEIMEDREIERERGRVMERECSRRRSIFDDMEFDDLFNNVNNNVGSNYNNGNDGGEREEGGRVSVCVPPKNALLLMRCKSDPMRMASLSQKFLEVPLVEYHDDEEEDEEDVVEVKVEEVVEVKEGSYVDVDEKLEVGEEEVVEIDEEEREEIKEGIDEMCGELEVVEQKVEDVVVCSEEMEEKIEEDEDVKQEEIVEVRVEEIEDNLGVEVKEEAEEKQGIENREETEGKQGICDEEAKDNREETEEKQSIENIEEEEIVLENVEETQLMEGENVANECSIEIVTAEEELNESENTQNLVEMGKHQAMEVQEERELVESCELSTSSSTTSSEESKELDTIQEKVEVEKELDPKQEEARKSMEKEKNKPTLPDCLLLMMCEPKLSMEVSKETWVCRSDFVRCLPERHPNKKPNKTDGSNDQSVISTKKTKPAAVAAQPPLPPEAQVGQLGIRPGRSSISFPTGGSSVANLIEQKLAKAGVGYEPFVLPRCKSAPMRSTAKFAQPELACSMWGRENGRKLELHRPATCGIGAAEVGF